MYTGILHLHDLLRWLLLVVMLTTLIKYLIGWLGNQSWKKSDHILGIALSSLIDLQLLIGLILYFFLSPITKSAFSDFGAAMKTSEIRFYAVEHFIMMLIAIVLVHIGKAKSKKARIDKAKFKVAFIYYFAALVIILVAIPWERI